MTTLALGSGERVNGSPVTMGAVATCETTYGINSSFFWADVTCSPIRSPNDETVPLALFARRGHVTVSLVAAISRAIANPNVPADDGLKRSCENGILNSARQPSGAIAAATSQTASHP